MYEDKSPELPRLIAEREALSRRVRDLDTLIGQAIGARQDDLARRLAAVEQAVHHLQNASAVVPPEAAPPVTVPRPSGAGSPRIVGERVTVDMVPLWASQDADAPVLGTLAAGTPVLLTDQASGHRARIAFRNQLFWVDSAWLGPVLAEAPQVVPPPTPPATRPAPAAVPVTAAPRTEVPDPRVPAPTTWPAGEASVLPSQPTFTPRTPAWRRPGFMAKLLALVGAAVTLIGVAFLLVLAAQYGMFGPEARTISAAVLAVVLIGLAFVVRGRDPRNVGAPILAATGVAAAFLSVVTATVIYGWLPALAGVGLAGLIGLGGMALARRWDNEWVGLVSLLGGLILAAFIGQHQELATAMMMAVLTGVTLWFERGTGWRLFPFARVLPTVWVLVDLSWSVRSLTPPEVWWLVALTAAVAMLGLFSAVVAPEEPPIGQGIALSLMVVMAVPAAMAPRLLQDSVAAGSVLGFLAVVFGTTGFLPKVHARVRWAAVPLGAGFATLAVLTFTNQQYLGVLTFVLACGYLAVAVRSKSVVNLIVGGVLAVIGVQAWLPLLFTVFSAEVAATAGPEQIAQSVAGIAVVVLATLAGIRWLGGARSWLVYVPWAVAIAMGSVAIIHAGTWVGTLAGNPAAGFQTGQAATTIAWMGLCVLFLQRGLATKNDADVWLHLALATSALAVAKLFLFDLAMLDAIARVGAFLVVGLLLLFVGTRYAKAWERAHGGGDASGPMPFAGETPVPAAGPQGGAAPTQDDAHA